MPSLPFQPCPGVASVTLEYTSLDGDIMENILHVWNGTSSAWTGAQLAVLVGAIHTWLTTGGGVGSNYVELSSNDGHWTGIYARDLTTASGPTYGVAFSTVGGQSAGQLQQGLTKAFTLRSGLAGRSQRGRVFQVGIAATWASSTGSDQVSPTLLADGVQMWTSLIAAVTTISSAYAWVVLSRYTTIGGVYTRRTAGVTTPIISIGYSHTSFDYQRRRAPDHARHH
jgi:hypothetical protein